MPEAWTIKASDNFNRADETLNTGNWSTGPSESPMRIVSQVAIWSVSLNTDCCSIYTGRSWAPEQSAQAKTWTDMSGAGAGPGVDVRAQTGSRNKYRAVVAKTAAGKASVELSRFNPTYTSLVTDSTRTYVAGAVLELRVRGTGTSTYLEVFYDGVPVIGYMDNGGSALAASGSPAIQHSGDTAGTFSQDDDFAGGEREWIAELRAGEFPKAAVRPLLASAA